MKYNVIKPDYYDDFSCIGGDCSYHCCQKWSIHLSQKEYKKLKNARLSPELKKVREQALSRIRTNSSTTRYAKMKLNADGDCPMLSESGLCRLQLEGGEESLSQVCRTFPRLNALSAGVLERHLSLACEVVVKLIMGKKDGIALVSQEEELKEDLRVFSLELAGEKKRAIYDCVFDIKVLAVAALQCRSLSLDDRFLLLGMFLKHIDELEAEKKEAEIPAYVDSMLSLLDTEELSEMWKGMKGDTNLQAMSMGILITNYYKGGMSSVSEAVKEKLKNIGVSAEADETGELVYTCNLETYEKSKERVRRFFSGREYILENILVTWFFTTRQPFHFREKSVWENYLSFAGLYQLLKGFLQCELSDKSTDEEFIQLIVKISRNLTHNEENQETLLKRARLRGTEDLASLAILIKD
ncbi:flagellin lysine-N-methylase [Sinanaerobacter sp. ZZT-01]|uniref:flagellin lysine-N-methylase n=1 Tax=Sinanaerobacter sp. ZZT-01 TaxID=3111540 RepID=UPI002D76ADAB|nr:flagellin lysine-N-methylase [Sinanaerobacter sp. ZZT-01]WRR94297.1 flagellin lysine-N-methylase [Sinanaerobacter sp. ZZT-01]